MGIEMLCHNDRRGEIRRQCRRQGRESLDASSRGADNNQLSRRLRTVCGHKEVSSCQLPDGHTVTYVQGTVSMGSMDSIVSIIGCFVSDLAFRYPILPIF